MKIGDKVRTSFNEEGIIVGTTYKPYDFMVKITSEKMCGTQVKIENPPIEPYRSSELTVLSDS